jgi:hypothetical protein
MRIWRFVMGAALLGGSAVAVACSSSSKSTSTDSGPEEASTEDAPVEAAACTPVSPAVDVATFDSGSSQWTCLQGKCAAELTTCASDCLCNNAIVGALMCAQADAAATMACFVNAIESGPGMGDMNLGNVGTCLSTNTAMCGGPTTDAGTEGGHPEASTGDAPTGDAPTGDAPTGDAPTGDAPSGDSATGDSAATDAPTSG